MALPTGPVAPGVPDEDRDVVLARSGRGHGLADRPPQAGDVTHRVTVEQLVERESMVVATTQVFLLSAVIFAGAASLIASGVALLAFVLSARAVARSAPACASSSAALALATSLCACTARRKSVCLPGWTSSLHVSTMRRAPRACSVPTAGRCSGMSRCLT